MSPPQKGLKTRRSTVSAMPDSQVEKLRQTVLEIAKSVSVKGEEQAPPPHGTTYVPSELPYVEHYENSVFYDAISSLLDKTEDRMVISQMGSQWEVLNPRTIRSVVRPPTMLLSI